MRKSYGMGLWLGGLALLACGDDPAGPSVGDEVAWQYACVDRTGDCKTSGTAHESSNPENKVKAR